MTEDQRNALERVEDLAFEQQVKRLTAARKFDELKLAFMLHGSTLTFREERDNPREIEVGDV